MSISSSRCGLGRRLDRRWGIDRGHVRSVSQGGQAGQNSTGHHHCTRGLQAPPRHGDVERRSDATARRVPGYYLDLLSKLETKGPLTPAILQQMSAEQDELLRAHAGETVPPVAENK